MGSGEIQRLITSRAIIENVHMTMLLARYFAADVCSTAFSLSAEALEAFSPAVAGPSPYCLW